MGVDDEIVSCPFCEDGVLDSGGVEPWEEPIFVPCPVCEGHAKVTKGRLKSVGLKEGNPEDWNNDCKETSKSKGTVGEAGE